MQVTPMKGMQRKKVSHQIRCLPGLFRQRLRNDVLHVMSSRHGFSRRGSPHWDAEFLLVVGTYSSDKHLDQKTHMYDILPTV